MTIPWMLADLWVGLALPATLCKSLHRWMLGSISERALSYAHCPVMIVHERSSKVMKFANTLKGREPTRSSLNSNAAQYSLELIHTTAAGPGKSHHV
jgi:hypothetical protein